MGKIAFLATLGNSDLQLDGKLLPKPAFRSLTEEIERDYEQYKNRLSLPLLRPSLAKAEELTHQKPNIVILFYTKQDPIHHQDTDVAFRIIKNLLSQDRIVTKGVRIEGRPDHYGAMLDFFVRYFERYGELPEFEEFERVFLGITGGTPAMSSALLLAGVLRLGSRADVLYVPMKSKEAIRLDAPLRFLKVLKMEEIKEVCRRKDYASALRSAEEIPSFAFPKIETLKHLLRAAYHRLLLDFDSALKDLNEAEPALSALPHPSLDPYQGWKEELRRLLQGLEGKAPPLGLLCELFFSTKVYLENKSYAPFLSSLFTLLEGIMGIQLERAIGIPAMGGEEERNKAFESWLSENPQVKEELLKRGANPQRGLNQKIATELLGILSQAYPECGEVYELSRELEGLRELRNRMTHRFEGVSKEKITKVYPLGPGHGLERVGEVLKRLGIDIEKDPYEIWNQWLEREWLIIR